MSCLHGSKASSTSIARDLNFRNKSPGTVLGEEGCGGAKSGGQGQKVRWDYTLLRFPRRHSEVAAALKYIYGPKFALVFVHGP